MEPGNKRDLIDEPERKPLSDELAQRSPSRRFVKLRSRLVIFFLILAGLSTFFSPLITADPLGHSRCSPYAFIQSHTGIPPAGFAALDFVSVYLLFIYLLLSVELFAVLLFPLRGLLGGIAMLCIFSSGCDPKGYEYVPELPRIGRNLIPRHDLQFHLLLFLISFLLLALCADSEGWSERE